MADLTAYRDGLLDADGSCRDVNFTPLTLNDCRTIVERVFSLAMQGTASDGDATFIAMDTGISTGMTSTEDSRT